MTGYRTEVLYIHPSPLGLVGDRWVIEHHCTTCRQHVAADQLITHARTHHNDQCRRTSHDKP